MTQIFYESELVEEPIAPDVNDDWTCNVTHTVQCLPIVRGSLFIFTPGGALFDDAGLIFTHEERKPLGTINYTTGVIQINRFPRHCNCQWFVSELGIRRLISTVIAYEYSIQ